MSTEDIYLAGEPSAGTRGEDPAGWLVAVQERSFRRASAATVAAYPAAARMTGAELVAYLSSGRHAVLATTRPDGRPHAVPSGLLLHDRAVWLPLGGGAVRRRNVAANPWASVVMAEGTGAAHRLVICEGPAGLVERPDEGLLAAARRQPRDMSWATWWIRMTPEKVFSYDGGKDG